MATKRQQIAIIATALSFLPANMVANAQEIQVCDPDRILTPCEKDLYDAGIVWESRAEQARESLNGCLDKLAVRTSTVVNNLVITSPSKPESLFSKQDILFYSVFGVIGFALGTLVTAALVN